MRLRRQGFTLAELVVAVTLVLLIFAIVVPYFRSQVRSMVADAGRDDAQQNARFGINAVDRDLRVAGAGIVDNQPLIVQADPYAITFNADLVSRDTGDIGAVYIDVDADPAGELVLQSTHKVTLPRSNFSYPDSTYMQGAFQNGTPLPSHSETISYWVSPDSSTGRTDDYILFRRVNDLAPRAVAKGIVLLPGQPVFRYFYTDSAGGTTEIPQTKLPYFHTAKIHGSNADTGRSAMTDSIKSVDVRLTTMYRDTRGDSARRTAEVFIRILNAGLVHHAECGDPPLAVTALTPGASVNAQGASIVTLTWPPSGDEHAGEHDVERYALYRRQTGTTAWNDPIASIPAGLTTYSYIDTQVKTGDKWDYAVIAQDCTPASSVASIFGPVIVP